MEDQVFEPTYPEPEQVAGIAGEITGQNITFGPGLAGFIRSEHDASLTRGGALSVAAGQDMELSYGGAGIAAIGRDMTLTNGGITVGAIGHDLQITNGGGTVLTAGGNLDITNGGAMVAAGNQVSLQNSSCGILLTRQAVLGENTRVIFNTPQALALGAAVGTVFALVSWLLNRR